MENKPFNNQYIIQIWDFLNLLKKHAKYSVGVFEFY